MNKKSLLHPTGIPSSSNNPPTVKSLTNGNNPQEHMFRRADGVTQAIVTAQFIKQLSNCITSGTVSDAQKVVDMEIAICKSIIQGVVVGRNDKMKRSLHDIICWYVK